MPNFLKYCNNIMAVLTCQPQHNIYYWYYLQYHSYVILYRSSDTYNNLHTLAKLYEEYNFLSAFVTHLM